MRRPDLDFIVPVTVVQGQPEALALLHRGGVPESVIGVAFRRGALFRVDIGKQQMVRNIFVASRALLGQIVRPSEQLQNGSDQLLLGNRLVRVPGKPERLVTLADAVPEAGERLRVRNRGLPFVGFPDAVREEIIRE